MTDSPEPPSSKSDPTAALSLVSSPTIRKIKLIVRKPPPTYSNPRQRPLKPLHGRSLSTFLSSYHTIDDLDVPVDAIDRLAQNEAALIDRIESYRREGRLRPDHDVLAAAAARSTSSPDASGNASSKPVALMSDPRVRGPDTWDHVVQAIVSQGQSQNQNRARQNKGKHITSQIAGKIQTYWDGYAARKDRARAQEEKRLRALAKSTIRMVVGEWKKAVFVSVSWFYCFGFFLMWIAAY